MPPVGLELTISACRQPQTYALDRAATGTGHFATSEAIFYLRGLKRCFNINKQGGKLRYRVFKCMFVEVDTKDAKNERQATYV